MDLCQHCGKEVETIGFRPKKFCNDDCRYAFHNKKKKKWTLKKLAKHYQETGEYLPEAEEAEELHIMSIADKIEEKLFDKRHNLCYGELPTETKLEHLISIEVGSWQAVHGFTRPWSDIKGEFENSLNCMKLIENFNKSSK